MTSIRLKMEESWYASMDCKVQKSGPWVCFYGGHSTGYKLGNHPKNIEPCAHRARTVRAPCAHRATTPPFILYLFILTMRLKQAVNTDKHTTTDPDP